MWIISNQIAYWRSLRKRDLVAVILWMLFAFSKMVLILGGVL